MSIQWKTYIFAIQFIMEITKIGIIGGGIMGYGIAIVCLQADFKVILFDKYENSLQNAKKNIEDFFEKSLLKGKISPEKKITLLSNIEYTSIFNHFNADYIIEAVPENLKLKQELFVEIEKNNPNSILASNTSTIPITRIASAVQKPQNMIGIHFFNPAPLMKLVEIIPAEKTSEVTLKTSIELIQKLQKSGVIVKDSPGFIVNRVARHYYLESLKILEENISDYSTIDNILENCGFKMGAFKLMDLIGIETNHSVTQSLYDSYFLEPRFQPSLIQQKKVDAGLFGKKTSEGFYKYD